MQLHLPKLNHVKAVSDKITDQLKLNSQLKLGVYQGLSHAIVEVAAGLAKLFPLKKKVYYIENQSLYFADAILMLAKEGYKIVPLNDDVLLSPEAWAEKIEREDLFVLYAADDSLFGDCYDISRFEKIALTKNIIKICVSHARHFYFKQEILVDKNSIQIFSLAKYAAIATMGERCRVSNFVADYLDIPADIFSCVTRMMEAKEVPDVAKNNLIQFEEMMGGNPQPRLASNIQAQFVNKAPSQRVSDAKLYFQTDFVKDKSLRGLFCGRLFDRTVIFWQDIDASAMIDRLKTKLNLAEDHFLESPCLSRWGNPRLIEYCLNRGLSEDEIRGLVIIDGDLVNTVLNLAEEIQVVRRSILADQFGPADSVIGQAESVS